MNSLEKLIYMANQIARNISGHDEAETAAAVAGHIHDFWDPRMKAMIFAHLDTGGKGLDPLARNAISQLARNSGHIAA